MKISSKIFYAIGIIVIFILIQVLGKIAGDTVSTGFKKSPNNRTDTEEEVKRFLKSNQNELLHRLEEFKQRLLMMIDEYTRADTMDFNIDNLSINYKYTLVQIDMDNYKYNMEEMESMFTKMFFRMRNNLCSKKDSIIYYGMTAHYQYFDKNQNPLKTFTINKKDC